ncbi:MAG TPA: hypothetical protein VGP26_27470 [Actinophytocola sp.]|nr:hypothetical protein [Actinophytocola sp.]
MLSHAPNQVFDYGESRRSSVLRATLSAYIGRSLDRFREVAVAAVQRVAGVPVDGAGLVVSELDSPAVVVTPGAPVPARRDRGARPAHRADRHRCGDHRGRLRRRGPLALAPERVVYAGTASKSLAPSLRLAWLVLPRFLVDPVLAAQHDLGVQVPVLPQLVLADLISSGAHDRHVRRDRLVAALPPHLTPEGIPAGPHLVLRVPLPAATRRFSVGVERLSPRWLRPPAEPGGIAAARNAFTPRSPRSPTCWPRCAPNSAGRPPELSSGRAGAPASRGG